jgi:hypothetical protein
MKGKAAIMLTQVSLVVLMQAERFLDELSIRQRATQSYLILALEFGEGQERFMLGFFQNGISSRRMFHPRHWGAVTRSRAAVIVSNALPFRVGTYAFCPWVILQESLLR